MDFANWIQEYKKINIAFKQADNEISFDLNEKLINQLVATTPKIVNLNIKIQNSPETAIPIDFTGIYPVTDTQQGLKLVVQKTITPTNQILTDDYYYISPMHNTQSLFLNENGWNTNKKLYKLANLSIKEINININININTQNIVSQPITTEIINSINKKKECVKCKQLIDNNIAFCPFCGSSQTVETINTCIKCKTQIPANAKFCFNCGAIQTQPSVPVVAEPILPVFTCVSCGNELKQGAKFCPKCGKPVTETSKISCIKCNKLISKTATYCPYCAEKQNNETEVQTPFCKKCGTQLKRDSKFCPKCGYKF